MKQKGIGIFGKTFFYTFSLIVMILIVTIVFFANQFVQFYAASRENQVSEIVESLIKQLDGQSKEEAKTIADDFIDRNFAVDIAVASIDGTFLYKTSSSAAPFTVINGQVSIHDIPIGENDPKTYKNDVKMQSAKVHLEKEEFYLVVTYHYSERDAYETFFKMLPIGLIIVFLVSVFGSAGYAKMITQPIKKLAGDTRKMSEMKNIPIPEIKNDEIGQLTANVHHLYDSLKTTITELKLEMDHVRKLEESQRYFFSSASHELKTPIAATSALLEGMLENIGDYKDHPKYLAECLKMMHSLNKLVVEILEIVRLKDRKVLPKVETIDLGLMVNSLMPAYQSLAGLKSQDFSLRIPQNQTCYADSQMLKRVLSNVIMNALQNAPENSLIKIWSEESTSTIKLCLQNQGYIDENAISKVFEPFYRMDSVRSRKDGHSGIGLTIVKELMNSMQIPYNLCNTEQGVLFSIEFQKLNNR